MNTDILFSYNNPDTKVSEKLTVTTGANSVYWGYNLNTQTYPTYGGEVVQILSCNITDLEIQGECRNYLQMEDIYRFFAQYMQYASQGMRGKPTKYLGNPINMKIPSRGWSLKIIPKSVPGFRLGTEVVAPEWRMLAQVYEDDGSANQQILSSIASRYYGGQTSIQDAINKTTTLSQIGYNPDSGFVNPRASLYENKDGKVKPNQFDGKALKENYKKRGEAYRQIVQSYIENDQDDAYGTLFDGNKSSSPAEPKDNKNGNKNEDDNRGNRNRNNRNRNNN